MIHGERLNRPEYVYPADEWRMVETRFYPKFLAQSETLFSTANGYLGMRGNFEEGRPVWQNGTFVNGFYESWPIVYGEQAFGFAADHALGRGAADHTIEHRKREGRGVADVARDAREPRVEHQDSDRRARDRLAAARHRPSGCANVAHLTRPIPRPALQPRAAAG